MDQSTLQKGQLFASRYQVLRCLAAGGMGAVYEVLDVETERHRALKVMLPELLANEDMRSRFQREARVTAKIQSEHLVDVFDAGVDGSTQMPFFVMELLAGEELGTAVQKRGPFAPTDVLVYLKQVASALDKTHQSGIVHRDLKPENLFLTYRDDGSPRVKILDFGVSKVLRDGSANITRTLGTPLYMSPEQLNGAAISPATDIYALGQIAYTLLVGYPYWQSDADECDNVFAFIRIAANGPEDCASVRASRAGFSLPPEFDAWFQRITAAESSARFETASAAIAALSSCMTGIEPLSARRAALPDPSADVTTQVLGAETYPSPALEVPTLPPVNNVRRKHPKRAVAVGAGITVLVLVGLGLTLASQLSRTHAESSATPAATTTPAPSATDAPKPSRPVPTTVPTSTELPQTPASSASAPAPVTSIRAAAKVPSASRRPVVVAAPTAAPKADKATRLYTRD